MTDSVDCPTADSLLREVAHAPEVSLAGRPGGRIGAQLGPYQLVGLLGAGGMGEVYRAHDTRLGREVAVKLLPRDDTRDPERRRRFEQEARAVAALSHPNILALHDVGSEHDVPYLVFELVEGEPLRARLTRGLLPVHAALDLAIQLARGLGAAHARGIAHRDLKPDNVIATPGGRFKIIDFGLAKPARDDLRVTGAASTAPGTVLGTVGYMSPEQVRGEPLDHRTDLFALGAILYEALAGRPAFRRPVRGPGHERGPHRRASAAAAGRPGGPARAPPHARALPGQGPHRALPVGRRPRVPARGPRRRPPASAAAGPAAPPPAAATVRIAIALAIVAIAVAIAAVVAAVHGRTADPRNTAAAPPDTSSPSTPSPSTSSPSTASPNGVAPSAAGGPDPHWLQPDDYFLTEQPWTQGWIHVHLAKLQQPATAASQDARFFELDSSREVWTAHYWRTRTARAPDLAIGAFAICFEGRMEDRVYQPPRTKDEARTGSWFLGKVTDTSDLARGIVRIDTYQCAVGGARIPGAASLTAIQSAAGRIAARRRNDLRDGAGRPGSVSDQHPDRVEIAVVDVDGVSSKLFSTPVDPSHVIIEELERVTDKSKRAESVKGALGPAIDAGIPSNISDEALRNHPLAISDRRPEIHHEARDESAGHEARLRKRHEARDELAAPVPQGFSSALSWTHYRTLTKVDDPAARAFYEIEAAREGWSVPHLERQIHTQLFARLLKSRDKDGVMDLARRGQTVERPIDLMKSPVVLDFLDLPDSQGLRENDLERAILSKLSQFLLELGKGFAFVARQKRLTFEDEEFYVDLVFYNVILKCYLLIDLKLGKLTHQDVGQMDSYVRLFDAQGRTEGDGPTIGLILCAEKNEAIARYSILSEHKQLFAAKYVTYLPSVEELERELERDRRIAEAIVETPRAVKPSSHAKGRKRRKK